MLVGIGALWGQVVRVRVGSTGERVDCYLGGCHGGRRDGKAMFAVTAIGEELASRRGLTYGALPDSPALALIRYPRVLTTILEPVIEERSQANKTR